MNREDESEPGQLAEHNKRRKVTFEKRESKDTARYKANLMARRREKEKKEIKSRENPVPGDTPGIKYEREKFR